LASSDGWGLSPLHPIPPSPDPHDPSTHPPITALQAHLAANPADIAAYFDLAAAYLDAGRLEDADHILTLAGYIVSDFTNLYRLLLRNSRPAWRPLDARRDAAALEIIFKSLNEELMLRAAVQEALVIPSPAFPVRARGIFLCPICLPPRRIIL
jgi:hypothetical protein